MILTVQLQIDWRDSLIGGAAKFRILNPKIGLDLFERAQKRENCDIAFGNWCVIVVFGSEGYRAGRQQRGADCCSTCDHPALQK